MSWLNKGVKVRADKQCLVPFFIRKDYSDEVLCDVLPIDAYHLLLGRPWEFYRDYVHQGRENTYSFILGKNKITLTPLPPSLKYTEPPSLVEHSEEVLMIGESELIQELNSREIILILLGVVIPNRAAYRSDPKATIELQKQVEELMSKGFVRESLSPCAVPVLLSLKKDGTW
ncbi:uncharacterized protein LOC141628799 [Silene latifolia]|uniref:uncharacterized protein LOC141628799 n=1 Tax=Silene latifolia TaxID=37657 RepID=UPI003D77B7A1